MKEQTIYIPTPISQKPEKEGYYVVTLISVTRDCYWTGEEWRFYRNVPEAAHGFTEWLRPTTLPQELAAKDKEIEKRAHEYLELEMELREVKQTAKQAIELLTDNHKLEIEKRDKEIAEKDLIIQWVEEGSELWKAEYDNCRAILEKLVDLKVMKDTFGNRIEGYERMKPLAWEAAKKFLEKYEHQ